MFRIFLAAVAVAGFLFAGSSARADDEKPLSASWKLRLRLEKPVNLPRGFDPGTALKDALEYLSDSHDVGILIDTAAFKAADPKSNIEEMPVQLPKMIGVTLHSLLRLTLNQANADLIVQNGFVVVLPRERTALPRLLKEGVDCTFHKRPVNEAIQELADATGVNLVMDVRIIDKAKAPVTATFTSTSFETALRVLTDMADLKPVILENVVYVTSKENARKLEEEEEQRKKAAPPAKDKKDAEPAPEQPAPAKGGLRGPDEKEAAPPGANAAPVPADPAAGLVFAKDVLPIFRAKCFACHSTVPKSGLSLQTVASITMGGKNGPAIKPGFPAQSKLVEMIASDKMPFSPTKLTPVEKKLIEDWIEGGAKE